MGPTTRLHGAAPMFDWDAGNANKNLVHGVHDWEIEEACLDLGARVVDHQ